MTKESRTVHGNINHFDFKRFSLERIILYICLTVIAVTWLVR